jgi:L-ascorbate metabolism protein UlaG (beta-lactamase superfamily)
MLLAPDVDAVLAPDLAEIEAPVVELGRRFLELDYDPSRCAEAVEELLTSGDLDESLVDLDAIRKGGVALTERVLFPVVDDWHLTLAREGTGAVVDITIGRDSFRGLADVLRILARSNNPSELDRLGPEQRAIFEPFVAPKVGSANVAPSPGQPGIFRREHASLLVQSRTTRILVDPAGLFRAAAFPAGRDRLAPIEGALDAVLVTHGHDDHWHLPSLFRDLATPDIPVVVPHVSRRNLLNRSLYGEELELAGQAARALPWGSELVIGDILVEVLAFHGEQPTREAPGAIDGLRSWGNCYVIRTPEISLLLLVDSGKDPSGEMHDVVARSVARHGPIDVVLSCLREFASPFFGGLEHYWAALPLARLRELYDDYRGGDLPSTTLGPAGVASLCGVAGAKYFLPYAHGFEGAGQIIDDIGWGAGEPSEAEVVEVLRQAAERVDARAWVPGDVAMIEGDDLVIRPYAR